MTFFSDAITFITQLSTDTLLIVLLLVGFLITTLYLGKSWTISFIFSLFIANILFERIPFDLPLENGWYVFGTIILLALVITSVVKRFISSDFPYKNRKKYTQSIILSVALVTTLLSTGLTQAYTFSPLISKWFTGDFLFWTSLIPLAILLFLIRK